MSYLSDLRDVHRMTYDQIARMLGISVHTLYSWTRRKGNKRPTAATRQLIRVLSVVARELPELHDALVRQAKTDN